MAVDLHPAEQYLRDLATELRRGQDGVLLPHRAVMQRLTQLPYPRPIVYADCVSTQERSFEADGQLTVLTDDLLGILTFEGAGQQIPDLHQRDNSQCAVSVISRTRLRSVTLVQDGMVNTSRSFEEPGGDDGLPYGTQLTLTYDGLEEPIRIPADPRRADRVSPALVSSLLDDLGR